MLQTLIKPQLGDIAPGFKLMSVKGEIIDLRADHLAGKPAILIVLPEDRNITELAFLADEASFFAKLGTRIYVLAADRQQLENGPDCLVGMPDNEKKLMNALGYQGVGQQSEIDLFLIAPNRHIAGIYSGLHHLGALKNRLQQMVTSYLSARLSNHAPVLMIPDILSPEECKYLINIYAMQGHVFVEPSHGETQQKTDYKMRIPEYGRKDRIDHWIKQPDTNRYIDERLARRLFPEIQKAFQYRITRREDYRIGCYEGERGGELHGHRDNSSPKVAHRRFACSINLNSEDFEGGEIRFPEFGNHLYRPPTGAAIVFSSSLLHEPMHVTSGKRFVLLAFLYGDH